MTNRQIIANVRSLLREISGDNFISNRAILSDLRATASLYIKRDFDRRKLTGIDSLYTTIPCLEMKEVPLAECCSYHSPCTIRRSVHKLPKVGNSIYGNIIDGVYSVDGSLRFVPGTAQRYANSLMLNLNKKAYIYWIQNDYLYISDSEIELVKIKAFFEEDVPTYFFECDPEKDKNPCKSTLDEEFKCPGYLITGVIDGVINKYAQIYKRIQNDQTDNDTEII